MGDIFMSKKIKNICLGGIGTALFVVLSLCLQVPVFENYYLCLGYVVMTIFCYSVGTMCGATVGTLGVILYCLLINGLRGMPGWAVGNFVLGIMMGFVFKLIKNKENKLLFYTVAIPAIIIITAISILGAKSIIECILYAQPFLVRVVKNIYAFIADAFVIIFSIPVCTKLDKYLKKIME